MVSPFKRPTQTVDDIENTVNQVFEDVSKNGDEAIASTLRNLMVAN